MAPLDPWVTLAAAVHRSDDDRPSWHPEQELPFAVALVLIWELAFPLAVFWRRVRWWILGFGIVFHLSTLFLMNIFFPHHLAMYLIFVNLDQLRNRFATDERGLRS